MLTGDSSLPGAVRACDGTEISERTTDVIDTTAGTLDCGDTASFVEPTFSVFNQAGAATFENQAPFTVGLFRRREPGAPRLHRAQLTSGQVYTEDSAMSDGLWVAVDGDDNIITINGECYVIMATTDDVAYTIP